MKKSDKFIHAAGQLDNFSCPVCHGPLHHQQPALVCPNRHSYNINKKGFVSFLSAPVDTCYDAALFQARRRVFDFGFFDDVCNCIDSILGDAPHRILDAGCGEGWYLDRLLAGHDNRCGAGIDISRDAIQIATSLPCCAAWCVADLRRLPFRSHSFTAILDILTPADYTLFRELLAEDGLLIKVYPGHTYLREIREARGLPLYEDGKVDEYLRQKTTVLETHHIHRVFDITPDIWRSFVYMTPLNQDLDEAAKEALAANPSSTITMDMDVSVCRL